MADVPDMVNIFAGIETRLATITGLQPHSETPTQMCVPAAWPDATSIRVDYDLDMGGSIALSLVVHLAAAAADQGLVRAQVALWPYLAASGTKSVKAAIEGDQTLGGKVQTLRVVSAQQVDTFEFGGVKYVGADFTLSIWP